MPGKIRTGIGGWTYEPWRGTFYPNGLPQKSELHFASRALPTLEINGTFYSTFKPDTWKKWRDDTPEDFIFSVKASRYCTNRKILAEAGPSIEKFLKQGLTELGPKLGPINWQLAPTKKYEASDCEKFLALLPQSIDGLFLRHALEVRHLSFINQEFYNLAKAYRIAIVHAPGSEFPEIDQATANFSYVRLMITTEDEKIGIKKAKLNAIVTQAKTRARGGDVYQYFISAAKVRNPLAAQAVQRELDKK